MTRHFVRAIAPALSLLALAGCGTGAPEADRAAANALAAPDAGQTLVTLTPEQIGAAGIVVVEPRLGGSAGSIELPATIDGDPDRTRVISAAIGGRLVSLTRNLGEQVRRGDTLAIIESREAASLHAAVEAAGARAALARSTLRREQRLFAERVSPEQDLIAARTAAAEAEIALRLARQQVAAAGGGGGGLNRLAIRAPIDGRIVARSAVLGQTVAADAELFRMANLDTVSVAAALSPADAGRVRPGSVIDIVAPGRRGSGRISFVSPVLDAGTRQVPVIASLDNRAGLWRVGEAVTATIRLAGSGDQSISIPATALQTIDGKPMVFVATPTGFRAVPVTPGRRDGPMVLIAAGLTGRERIAAANSFILKAELGKNAAGEED